MIFKRGGRRREEREEGIEIGRSEIGGKRRGSTKWRCSREKNKDVQKKRQDKEKRRRSGVQKRR